MGDTIPFVSSACQMLYVVAQVLETQTGRSINWENSFEVEVNARKRAWLQHFSNPTMLCSDVTALSGETSFNYMCESETVLPSQLALYSFGFSCKYLSTLNNESREWQGSCIGTGQGTTGATWKGNLEVVEKTKVWVLLMENVPSARCGRNYENMVRDLGQLGYVLFDEQLNASDFGLPQSRKRAWFLAFRQDMLGELSQDDFKTLLACSKVEDHLPLQRFLLPPSHQYLLDELHAKHLLKERRPCDPQGKSDGEGTVSENKADSRKEKAGCSSSSSSREEEEVGQEADL